MSTLTHPSGMATCSLEGMGYAQKVARDLRPGDHIWAHGIIETVLPRAQILVTVQSGDQLPYDPKETVLLLQ